MNNQANQKIYPENLFKKDEKDKVSIEHIYPQTDTNEYWVERFGNYTDTQRKYLNGSLGNLLPLSLSINVKLQNYSFDDKKHGLDRTRGYENGSHSEMQVAKCFEWTPEEILNRGLTMISFMEKRYDFIIPNKAERIKMLGLDFMIKDEDNEIDVTIPENKEVENSSLREVIYDENQKFEIGKAIQIGEGNDGTVFATGVVVNEAIKAKEELEKQGINIRVVDIHTIKPIDEETIIKCAKETKKLVSIEDHSVINGLGTAISDVLTEKYPTKLIKMGIQDEFGRSGKATELLEYYGLTADGIIHQIING